MLGGFTVHRRKLLRSLAGIVSEDSYRIREITFGHSDPLRKYFLFSIADGVTRDLRNGQALDRSFFGYLLAAMLYPKKQNPAHVASHLFVDRSVRGMQLSLQLRSSLGTNEGIIQEAFSQGNREIRSWQEQHVPKVDYLANDFPGCVGAVGLIHPATQTFSYGFICDAGVALFDSEGNKLLKTPNEGPDEHDSYIWQTEEMKGLNWREAAARVNVRKIFRNNPDHPTHGDHTFGVLTGEENALRYVRTGEKSFLEGHTAIGYTDGVEPVLFNRDDVRGAIADLIRERRFDLLQKVCRREVGSEGSLVYFYQ